MSVQDIPGFIINPTALRLKYLHARMLFMSLYKNERAYLESTIKRKSFSKILKSLKSIDLLKDMKKVIKTSKDSDLSNSDVLGSLMEICELIKNQPNYETPEDPFLLMNHILSTMIYYKGLEYGEEEVNLNELQCIDLALAKISLRTGFIIAAINISGGKHDFGLSGREGKISQGKRTENQIVSFYKELGLNKLKLGPWQQAGQILSHWQGKYESNPNKYEEPVGKQRIYDILRGQQPPGL